MLHGIDLSSAGPLLAFVQVVFVDLVLAGDNAVVVGMAIAGLPREQRAKAMVLGIGAAAVLRILFAVVTVQLLQIKGLNFAGGLLLLWVCWRLWRELEEARHERRRLRQGASVSASNAASASDHAPSGDARSSVLDEECASADTQRRGKTLRQASMQVVLADLSMSLDNVLAVASIARDHLPVLVIGLVLSVVFMGLAAVLIARILNRYPWVAYVGLALIFYVALRMLVEGGHEVVQVVTAWMGA